MTSYYLEDNGLEGGGEEGLRRTDVWNKLVSTPAPREKVYFFWRIEGK
jgi:hypothetical protein